VPSSIKIETARADVSSTASVNQRRELFVMHRTRALSRTLKLALTAGAITALVVLGPATGIFGALYGNL
jgi:hypothetical protein